MASKTPVDIVYHAVAASAPAPMANGSPKTAPPPRLSESIIVHPETPRPSRSLTDWITLAGMFIFLVILSHGRGERAEKTKRAQGAQLAFSPPAVPPLPYPVGFASSNIKPYDTAAQVRVSGGHLGCKA